MTISQLDWLNQINAQVDKFMRDNGGPTSNPLISIDAKNLKTMIGLAHLGLNQGRPVMGSATTLQEALQHYQQSLQKKNDTIANVPFAPKPKQTESYLNAVMTKISKDDH